MAELKQQYDEKLAQKEELKRRAEHTELMLDRASKLVSGLAGERIRWQETVKVRLISHFHFKFYFNLIVIFLYLWCILGSICNLFNIVVLSLAIFREFVLYNLYIN